jgi:hypothetical protein
MEVLIWGFGADILMEKLLSLLIGVRKEYLLLEFKI